MLKRGGVGTHIRADPGCRKQFAKFQSFWLYDYQDGQVAVGRAICTVNKSWRDAILKNR